MANPYPAYTLDNNNPNANPNNNTFSIAAQAARTTHPLPGNNFNDLNRDMENMDHQENANYELGNKNLGGDLYSDSRGGFVRKVYTLLSLQLIFTALVCVWAMKSEFFKNVFGSAPVIIIVSVLLMVLSISIACCCQDAYRKYGLPILIVFTILFAILVGIVCSKTKPEIVLAATGITALIVVGLTLYACFTKTDLTGCGPYLFVFVLVMIVFGIVCIFWKNPIVHLVYACLAALLYSIYLIFDTQLVLGKFQNSYSFDDAYFAALMLYIDIIEIFLQILRILSYANN